jgi:hypothetical protein
MEERMVIKYQLPALALAVGLVTIALALLNADKIGDGLTLGVVALISVRYWGAPLRRRVPGQALRGARRPHGLEPAGAR